MDYLPKKSKSSLHHVIITCRVLGPLSLLRPGTIHNIPQNYRSMFWDYSEFFGLFPDALGLFIDKET